MAPTSLYTNLERQSTTALPAKQYNRAAYRSAIDKRIDRPPTTFPDLPFDFVVTRYSDIYFFSVPRTLHKNLIIGFFLGLHLRDVEVV